MAARLRFHERKVYLREALSRRAGITLDSEVAATSAEGEVRIKRLARSAKHTDTLLRLLSAPPAGLAELADYDHADVD